MADSRFGTEMYGMSLERFVWPENKKAIKVY